MINSVFFDLDGTLLDTGPDLAEALNQTLKKYKRSNVDYDAFRFTIYGGSRTMIENAFNIEASHPEFEAIKTHFLKSYFNCLGNNTAYFDGIEPILAHLESNNYIWGIVTNKPGWLTDPIIDRFQLAKRSHCIIAGDTLTKRKPHPDQLHHACKLTGANPETTVYVGDTENDIIAAKAAGMKSIAVTYGYHPLGSKPASWDADHCANHPDDILSWLSQRS